MKRKTKLRLAGLIMLAAAAVFLFRTVSCPALGQVFCRGPFRIAAAQRWAFYGLCAGVAGGLFLLSFFIRERKDKGDG